MITLPIGLVLTSFVILWAVGLENLGLFLNTHGLAVVFGGSLGILLFSTPVASLINLFKTLMFQFKADHNLEENQQELLELSKTKTLSSKSENELINYAHELWQQGTDENMFIVLLAQKRESIETGEMEAVQVLKNLAKYPPALGMTGTVMGLVTLFSGLTADNKGSIGPALALAMTATFYGLFLSNGLVLPLADRMTVKHIHRRKYFMQVYQLLLLIHRNEPFALIEDEVKQRAAA